MSTTNQPSTYLLLFRNTGPENYQGLTARERQDLLNRWNAWYEALARAGKAIEGQPLETETRIISGPAGSRITDGPFPEAKEAVGGYVKLLAQSLEEATEAAQSHPALDYGMLVEVRQATDGCHLGVSAHQRKALPTQPV